MATISLEDETPTSEQLGEKLMAVFIDIYDNEARVPIGSQQFGRLAKTRNTSEQTERPKKRRGKRAKASR